MWRLAYRTRHAPAHRACVTRGSAQARTLSVDELGAWSTPVARQHEITVLQLLMGLATAIYTAFPTTIQQVS